MPRKKGSGPTPGSFKKGQSGNPKGRPRSNYRLTELAKAHTETALKTLVEICTDPNAREAARVKAAEVLLDRGHGRAPQHSTLDVTHNVRPVELTDDQLRHIAATGELPEGASLQ